MSYLETYDLKSSSLNKKNTSFFQETKAFLLFISTAVFALLLLTVNIYFLSKRTASLSKFLTILLFGIQRTNGNSVTDSLEINPIYRAIWICSASIIGAIALVISGAFIQSLTQNPLADTTTLGFISSTIFGIIFMKGIISSILEVSNYHILYFLFALVGGLCSLLILSVLFKRPQSNAQHLKIILVGLVLNMIFKTFTYLIRAYHENAANTSLKLAMGGAENIYDLYSNQFVLLKWCGLGLFGLLTVSMFFSRNLNLFELGEEQAKTLGVNVKLFKYLGYTITLLASTIAIVLIGNITFLGLICTHSIRHLLKTRKYQIIIPIGSALAILLLLLGVLLNSLFPFISSSIFILFLGGCVLLSLSLRSEGL